MQQRPRLGMGARQQANCVPPTGPISTIGRHHLRSLSSISSGKQTHPCPWCVPAWSLAGKQVAFPGVCRLCPPEAASESRSTACANDSSYANQAWSPDGRWIASVFEPGLISDQDDFRLVVVRTDLRGQSGRPRSVPPLSNGHATASECSSTEARAPTSGWAGLGQRENAAHRGGSICPTRQSTDAQSTGAANHPL